MLAPSQNVAGASQQTVVRRWSSRRTIKVMQSSCCTGTPSPQFASGIVLDNGLILNNRAGRGFDVDAAPDSVNAPRAGRIPWTTLHAWILERDSGLVVGATPGGVNQLPWNAQTVTEIARGGTLEGIP